MADTKNPIKPVSAATTPVLEARPSISRRDDKIEYERPAARPAWRDKLGEAFKTFLWVAPLTALIWIYAERAQIASLEVSVPIKVTPASPDRLVTLLAPADRRVTLDLRGPRASLDAIREQLTNARPVEVTIPDEIGPKFEGDISITERIERNPLFQDWALDVERSFPAVRIRVEPKASRVLPVRLKPEDSGFGDVTFDPPTVTIEGPQSVIEKIPPGQAVYTDLNKLRAYKPGDYQENVSVLDFNEENVTKTPAKVLATVNIGEGEKLMLPSVTIWVAMPANMVEFKQHVVSPADRPTLPNVEVSGPPAQIARLRPGGDFQPKVRVELEPADLLQQTFVKRVFAENYVLPTGVTVINANKDIRFNVNPR